jgi:prevent-host-death family protein
MGKQSIAAAAFKTKCLALLDEVQHEQKEIVITKRGKPVAKLVPVRPTSPPVFGRMKGTIEILGDIVGPTGEDWDAERGIIDR